METKQVLDDETDVEDWGDIDETDHSEGTRRMGDGFRSLFPRHVRGRAERDTPAAVCQLDAVLSGNLPLPTGAGAAERSSGVYPLGADLLGPGDGFSAAAARR